MSSTRFRQEAFGDDVDGFASSRDPLLAGGDKEVWLKIWHEQSTSSLSHRPSCSVMIYAAIMVTFGTCAATCVRGWCLDVVLRVAWLTARTGAGR